LTQRRVGWQRTGLREKRRGGDQIIERRPVLVVAVADAEMAGASRRRNARGGFCA
jgi:hypothetical protein